MEIVSRAAAAAIIGSILALLLKKHVPELSLVLALITGTVIVWISSTVCGQVVGVLRDVAEQGSVASIYTAPVMKCVGIGLVTNLAAQICRDAQQGSIAAAVELCGTLCALYVSVPLLRSVLSMVEKLL